MNLAKTSLEKEKMPLSYSFLVEEIAKENEELALKLDDFIIQDVRSMYFETGYCGLAK